MTVPPWLAAMWLASGRLHKFSLVMFPCFPLRMNGLPGLPEGPELEVSCCSDGGGRGLDGVPGAPGGHTLGGWFLTLRGRFLSIPRGWAAGHLVTAF